MHPYVSSSFHLCPGLPVRARATNVEVRKSLSRGLGSGLLGNLRERGALSATSLIRPRRARFRLVHVPADAGRCCTRSFGPEDLRDAVRSDTFVMKLPSNVHLTKPAQIVVGVRLVGCRLARRLSSLDRRRQRRPRRNQPCWRLRHEAFEIRRARTDGAGAGATMVTSEATWPSTTLVGEQSATSDASRFVSFFPQMSAGPWG